jgi:hydrophobic/amphiphilic exporter-1 (mainly G- bacteria), HAE1 family
MAVRRCQVVTAKRLWGHPRRAGNAQRRVTALGLPPAVQSQGVTVAKKASSFLEFITLVSPDSRFDSLFLSNYAVISIQNELARLKGVGAVTIFGAGQYAMRIWMNPDLLQARGLTPQDVINAIQQQREKASA